MDTSEIRRLFTSFFAERGHRHIPSSSLIPPPEERTLLFTNAGMNPMKPYFMGLTRPAHTRLTSIQKCFRTSDIEEVGDATHHTFFEMLGNFSVGDYFKDEIIPWAWELLIAKPPQGMGLDAAKLWATVYLDDDESYALWRRVGMARERIVRFDESENYWFMIKGGAGPCGPNTEIYYDYGADQGCQQPGCSPPTHDCGRFVELWNLVFMTLYQDEDGSRRPLPQRNVDTGAGLERWMGPFLWQERIDWQGGARDWQAPPTNYDNDLFQPVLARVGELAGKSYGEAPAAEQRAMRIVAEHARAATFLIADGVAPGNDGRGYVLRRLIRRATSFGQRLSEGRHFLDEAASAVVDTMSGHYDSLLEQAGFVRRTLETEESRFFETLELGRSQIDALKASGGKIGGRDLFQLWDTHVFPTELTLELLVEDGFSVEDPETFERLMAEQRARSRAAGGFEADSRRSQTYAELSLPASEFVGYEHTRFPSQVSAILIDGTTVVPTLTPELAAGRRVEVVLTRTPFYAEGGGQVGDRGEIVWRDGHFIVEDTQAIGDPATQGGGVIAHIGRLEVGSLSAGDAVEARVDAERRGDTMRNHTATHILHGALRQVLGGHVRQAGSLVSPERLRFDFTHLEALTPDEVRRVEALANRAVRQNIPVEAEYLSFEEALQGGALAFFGDKYADTVRVVAVCEPGADRCFSRELCGGTHVHASGEVGAVIITAETSIGAGLRRIEAVTGRVAAERVRGAEETLSRLSASLRAPPAEVESRLTALREENERLRRQLQAAERRLAQAAVEAQAGAGRGDGAAAAERRGETAVIVRRLDTASNDALRAAGDALKSRHQSAVILVGGEVEGKPSFVAMATADVAKRCPAGEVVRAAAQATGGGGGGRPEVAQGGGTDVSKIDAALAAGRRLIAEKLSAA